VTGAPYTNAELEMLFTLASHVAMAIQDIFSYHQLDEKKNCIENILKHMSSGLIAIDKQESITICNQRALTILNTEESVLLNKDLRNLPSPLGDMLFETMTTGRVYEKTEVELLPHRLPLELTTYQINDRDSESVGSVIIFDDISSRKQLAEQKLLSEQLELVNGIVERIAHDIKNPLVSIQTFLELYQERSNDPSFFAEFGSVANHDLERLNELLEQLVALVESKQYRFELIDINALLNECILLLREETADESCEIVTDLAKKVPPVKCDRETMKQAFWYLMKYLANTMENSDKLSIMSLVRQEPDGLVIRITMIGNGNNTSKDELDKLFDPLAVVRNADIDLGPCASLKVIEEHGGRVEVKSQNSGRISFVIDIPPEQ
jgi:nitrogen fixation/metabolism regulation signal transduction histidine kinase